MRISQSIRAIAKRTLFPVPAYLKKNQIQINGIDLNVIEKSIKKNYHTGWRSEQNYSKEMYEEDLHDHISGRMDHDRRRIIPWLDSLKQLNSSQILEIGCGTGSSTVALAEQGAKVIGIDVDEGALIVAKDRCKVYGLDVEFRFQNANEISMETFDTRFDYVIFFACLEHMTINERISSLKNTWEMLDKGGFLVIIETPNRLWYFDNHTSNLPFFHWLPNELAFRYSCFSSRENFRDKYKKYDTDSKIHFLRRGRGLSFHEIEIAINPVQKFKLICSVASYEGFRHQLLQSRLDRKYKSILKSIFSGIHSGFFEEFLFLVIKKD